MGSAASSASASKQRRASDQPSGRSPLFLVLAALGTLVAVAAAIYFVAWPSTTVVRDGAPNWAPDGKSIVFIAERFLGDTDGPVNLFVMDPDGSNRREITTTASHDLSPAFSPDGNLIAFESDRDGNSEIYVTDRVGRSVRRLTRDAADDRSPAWSADGRHIAFMSTREAKTRSDIFQMNADGSGVERLTNGVSAWAPQYSPDGRLLALQIDTDVYVMDLATRTTTRLTYAPQNGMNPTWSPDGKRLAFVTSRNRRLEIFTMSADGSGQQVLVSMPRGSAIDPRWSPDGARVAFVYVPAGGTEVPAAGTDSQAIYLADIASGRLSRVSP